MSSGQLYDTIGGTYAVTRRTEPRIAAQVWAALGDARTVLNVGAGTGSYEPPGPRRHRGGAVGGDARAAPGRRGAVRDGRRAAPPVRRPVLRRRDGVRHRPPLARPARRAARAAAGGPPGGGVHARQHRGRLAAPVLADPRLPARGGRLSRRPAVADRAGPRDRRPGGAGDHPWDCADGFFEAYWRRPEAYLDAQVRRGMSVWNRVGPEVEQRAVRASATTSPPAGGPSATASSSISTRPTLGLRLLIG